MSTKIYGASDDLIEFEGDVYGEVGCFDTETLIVCDDGTILTAMYSDAGLWKFNIIKQGQLFDRIVPCPEETDGNYSDYVFFKDGLKRVYAAKRWELVK